MTKVDFDPQNYSPVVITVDGTAASGKGTIVRGLLDRLDDYRTLDAGSMYRLFTHMCRFSREGEISPEMLRENHGILKKLMNHNQMDFLEGRLLLNGGPIDSEFLRGPEIDNFVADYAAIPEVKNYIVNQQKEIVSRSSTGWVLDGRCMGTAVAPDASVKFFVDAPVHVRATRRHADYEDKGVVDLSVEEVKRKLEQRDKEDYAARPFPLKKPEDAYSIESSELSKYEAISYAWDKVMGALISQRRNSKSL